MTMDSSPAAPRYAGLPAGGVIAIRESYPPFKSPAYNYESSNGIHNPCITMFVKGRSLKLEALSSALFFRV